MLISCKGKLWINKSGDFQLWHAKERSTMPFLSLINHCCVLLGLFTGNFWSSIEVCEHNARTCYVLLQHIRAFYLVMCVLHLCLKASKEWEADPQNLILWMQKTRGVVNCSPWTPRPLWLLHGQLGTTPQEKEGHNLEQHPRFGNH